MPTAEGYKQLSRRRAHRARGRGKDAIRMAEDAGFVPYTCRHGAASRARRCMSTTAARRSCWPCIGQQAARPAAASSRRAHVDSPRLDLKQTPMYEDYGAGVSSRRTITAASRSISGSTIPLELHGVVALQGRRARSTSAIGRRAGRPAVCHHRSAAAPRQRTRCTRRMAEGITGEALNILIGSRAVCRRGAATV